mmetsp:Transcript_22828/g.74344  ORF Transcript_22828/g.74344 Transcript_22828/m.74344 type:complete len:271 (-) Transcript_22828:71-883(-)
MASAPIVGATPKHFCLVEMAGERLQAETFVAPSTIWTDLQVLKAMFFSNISGTTHQDQLESFYASQAHLYDGYRHRMLHGRAPMMHALPAREGATWVDLGGGTGANLEFFNKEMSKFKAVTLVDLTPSLAKQAEKRKKERGWTNVSIVLGDATDPNLKGLPKAGTCDLVTISYALTMIPNWEDALANAKRLLKPGGTLAICDFTVHETQFPWMRTFWTKVFATDHVHLNAKHLPKFQEMFEESYYEFGYGKFPYVPFLRCPWHVFMGIKK